MLSTSPTGRPPTFTWFPLTSWPGVVERHVHAIVAAGTEHQDRGRGHGKTEGDEGDSASHSQGRRYSGSSSHAPVGAARRRELTK